MAEDKFKNTYEVLDDWMNKVVDEMEAILTNNKKRATGNLIQSLDYDIYDDGKGTFTLEIEYAEYGKYIIDGRKRGSKQPPIREIENWLKTKNINFTKAKDGRKLTIRQLSFAVAKSISRKGIKAVNFVKPYQDLQNNSNFKKDVIEAFVKDTEDNIATRIKVIQKNK